MNVSGEDNLEIFKDLMRRVIKEANINILFLEFRTQQQKYLAKKIAQYFNKEEDYPISANAIRDYRYACDPSMSHVVFSVSEDKLDFLCRYIGEKSWGSFAKERFKETQTKFTGSYYRSYSIFQLLLQKEKEIGDIITTYEKTLRRDRYSAESLFNIGIGYMSLKHFESALAYFEEYLKLELLDARGYFFTAVCLLRGKRPYRHKKVLIDKVIGYLQKANQMDPEQPSYIDTLFVIHGDFHARLGYSYAAVTIGRGSRSEAWVTFLQKYFGIPENELKTFFQ